MSFAINLEDVQNVRGQIKKNAPKLSELMDSLIKESSQLGTNFEAFNTISDQFRDIKKKSVEPIEEALLTADKVFAEMEEKAVQLSKSVKRG